MTAFPVTDPDARCAACDTAGTERNPLIRLSENGRPTHNYACSAYNPAYVAPPVEDLAFGEGVWVYCKQHVRAHTTGWCSVGAEEKTPLNARDAESAFEEVKALGLPIFGHCEICYRYIANEHPYRVTCPEHGQPR